MPLRCASRIKLTARRSSFAQNKSDYEADTVYNAPPAPPVPLCRRRHQQTCRKIAMHATQRPANPDRRRSKGDSGRQRTKPYKFQQIGETVWRQKIFVRSLEWLKVYRKESFQMPANTKGSGIDTRRKKKPKQSKH